MVCPLQVKRFKRRWQPVDVVTSPRCRYSAFAAFRGANTTYRCAQPPVPSDVSRGHPQSTPRELGHMAQCTKQGYPTPGSRPSRDARDPSEAREPRRENAGQGLPLQILQVMAPHLSNGKTRSAVGIESAAGLAGLMRMSPVPFDGTWKLPWNQSGRQQDVPWAWRRVARTRPACIPVD